MDCAGVSAGLNACVNGSPRHACGGVEPCPLLVAYRMSRPSLHVNSECHDEYCTNPNGYGGESLLCVTDREVVCRLGARCDGTGGEEKAVNRVDESVQRPGRVDGRAQ